MIVSVSSKFPLQYVSQLLYLGMTLIQAPEALVVKSVSFGKTPPSEAFSQLQEPAQPKSTSVIVTNNSQTQSRTCSPQSTCTSILRRLLILRRSSFTRTGACRSSTYNFLQIVSNLCSHTTKRMIEKKKKQPKQCGLHIRQEHLAPTIAFSFAANAHEQFNAGFSPQEHFA